MYIVTINHAIDVSCIPIEEHESVRGIGSPRVILRSLYICNFRVFTAAIECR